MTRQPDPKGSRAKTAAIIAGIAIVAVALRFWRLDWGYTEEPGFPDERLCFALYGPAFVPLTWASFDAQSLVYPTLYGYLVGFATALGHLLGWVATPVRMRSPELLLVARGVSAVLGLATVALAGVLAARMYGRKVGLAAAALLAVTPLHAMLARIAATDVALTACVVLVMLLSFESARRPSAWVSALAGAAAGLGFATKYTGLALLVPVLCAVLERARTDRSLRTAAQLGLAAAIGFALAFTLACPPCVLRAGEMLGHIQKHRLRSNVFFSTADNNWLSPTLGWYAKPYLYELVATFPYSLGWPLYALALVGFVLAVARHGRADRIVLATMLPYFAVLGWSGVTYPRYFLPLLPGFVVLAARAALAMPMRTRAVVLTSVLLYSFALATSQIARFSFDQQREVARWIAENVEPASGSDGKVRVAAPQFPLGYFRLERPFKNAGFDFHRVERGAWFGQSYDAFVLPEWYEIAIERDQPNGDAALDLARLRSGRAGYRRAARWSSSYVQRDLDERIDPGLVSDLWQGEIGFTVYVRDGAREAITDLPLAVRPR